MYDSCDESGNEYLMMDSIVDHRKSDRALSVSSQKMVHRGWSFMWRSKVGCQICAQWRDESTSCQALKDLMEYHSLETKEYAVDQEIYHKTALNWVGKAVLRRRLRIISFVKKTNAQYVKKTHTFFIQVP